MVTFGLVLTEASRVGMPECVGWWPLPVVMNGELCLSLDSRHRLSKVRLHREREGGGQNGTMKGWEEGRSGRGWVQLQQNPSWVHVDLHQHY